MGINLAFGDALQTNTGQVDLAFGAAPAGTKQITLAGQLPPLVSRIVVGRLFQANIAATLAPPAANIRLDYDIAVWNGISAKRCSSADDARQTHAASVSAFQQGERLRVPQCAGTDDAVRIGSSATAAGTPAPALHLRRCATFGDADRLGAVEISVNSPLDRAHVKRCSTFAEALQSASGLVGAQHILYQRPMRLFAGFDNARFSSRANCGGFRFGIPLARKTCTRFVRALPAPWGVASIVTPPPKPGRCYTSPAGFVALAFDAPLPGHANLAFICLVRQETPGETLIVPVRRVYIVLNSAALIRLPGLENILCHGLRISTDADSWTWGFSAEIAASALDSIAPVNGDPVEVQATVNGIAWRFLVEKIRRNREFGKATITISGRSLAAWLAAPYAAQVNHASATPITAQQIVNAALPAGWSLDWNVEDWLIPGGLWSAYATPMEVALKINGAIGGILQNHSTDNRISIGSRYPVTPWELAGATPHIQIPSDVMVTDSIEWMDKPAWNAVYVCGENQGIVGHVKRTGSAADLGAPMVTDSLITATEAARQRGAVILSGAGRQALVTADLPLMPNDSLGLITPGMVLEIVDGAETWRGYARSVSVSATLPKVRQTIEIERPVL